MKVVLSVSALRNACCLTLFTSSAFLSGCMHSPAPVHVISVAAASARTTASSAARVISPEQAAMAQVQTLPLYQQAEQACKAKRYSQAAALLLLLAARPALTAEEAAFVRQQRAICLHDAGLPVRVAAASPGASASARRFPVSKAASTSTLADADCGPRALLLLCQRLGVKTDLQTLRQKAGTTTEGTSLAGLAAAAKAVGLKAEGVQVSREALHEVELPAIAYTNGSHFIAVIVLQGREESATVTVQDPNAAGEETMPQERLLRLCSGYLLLVKR